MQAVTMPAELVQLSLVLRAHLARQLVQRGRPDHPTGNGYLVMEVDLDRGRGARCPLPASLLTSPLPSLLQVQVSGAHLLDSGLTDVRGHRARLQTERTSRGLGVYAFPDVHGQLKDVCSHVIIFCINHEWSSGRILCMKMPVWLPSGE